ncbi:MAG: Lrp/AsnC family transcriptional regulator [Candidatus Diapherotrites archaeon]|nr:Lrp/AsnC family transcriptional regulator [Candidatus Diapherotrites archaeon]
MYKLDLIDRKLLVELDRNSRQPVAALAKKVRLSKQAVKQRLEKLEREKVILGYYAVIDVFKLQRQSARLWIKLQGNYSEDEIIRFALQMPNVGWVLRLDGAYDLAIILWSRDMLELDNAVKELNFRFGAFLKTVDVSFIVRAHHISHRYLTNEKSLHELIMEQRFSRFEIDETDGKILGVLAQDSRASLVGISKRLGISDKTAKYRIKRLEKEKIILGYMVLLDYAKIGYTWHKVFLRLQNLSAEKYRQLISFLKSKTNVMFVTEAIGISDLEFEAMLQTPRDFHELMKEIRQGFPDIIKEFSWITVFKTEKVYYSPQV